MADKISINYDSFEQIGNIRLVEISIVHELPDTRLSQRHPVGGHDNFIRYIIDAENQKVILNPHSDKGIKNKMNDSEIAALTNDGVEETSSSIYGYESVKVPIQTGVNASISKYIQVSETEKYKYPEVTIDDLPGQKIRVGANDNELIVSVGNSDNINLDEEQVKITPRQSDTTEIPDPRKSGDTISVRRLSEPEMVTVVPKISIQNYGELKLYEK
jgi:hypothetical protein